MKTWIVADSLYCPEQWPCSHLDSYSYYIGAYPGIETWAICFNGWPPRAFGEDSGDAPWPMAKYLGPDGPGEVDVAFILDRYDEGVKLPARKHIAQVAAICNPMPWDVRKPDDSPAYDLVISSLRWMVEEARAKGCRAEFMPLAFDMRARVFGMGVKRDIPLLFVGTRGPNHQRREAELKRLGDQVTIMPPTFGRAYFALLARAHSVLQVHAEWARGEANAMRIFEAAGMGCIVEATGRPDPWALGSPVEFMTRNVLMHHTYESRIPRLVELAESL